MNDQTINVTRRKVLMGMAAGSLAGLSGFSALANTHATVSAGPIKLISMSSPGAAGDTSLRLIANYMQPVIGKSVLVENRPGAGGHIAGEFASRSRPDGSTVLSSGAPLFALRPILFPTLGYDPLQSLKPVGYTVAHLHVLLASKATNVKTLDDFVVYAKKHGSAVNYGSGGVGHPIHLYVEKIQKKFGTQMTHIPYKGMPFAMQALVTNDIQFLVLAVSDVLPYIQDGSINLLATTGPDIPGIELNAPRLEDVYPDLAHSVWSALWVPTSTPQEIVARLSETLASIKDVPEYQRALSQLGMAALKGSPEEVLNQLQKESTALRNLAQEIGLKK